MDDRPLGILPENHDDKLIAAVSHAMILLPFVGVVLTGLIWINQREKSRYVAFQSLQAGIYQICSSIIAIPALIFGFFIIMFSPILIIEKSLSELGPFNLDPDNFPALSNGLLQFILFVLPFLMISIPVAFVAYALVGTFMSLSGKSFRYIFIGGLAEKSFIKLDPTNSNYNDGIVIWGWLNRMWPFAKIKISEDKIMIYTSMKSLIFPKKDINKLKKIHSVLGMALKIDHSITKYPTSILFYSYNFKDLIINMEKLDYEIS